MCSTAAVGRPRFETAVARPRPVAHTNSNHDEGPSRRSRRRRWATLCPLTTSLRHSTSTLPFDTSDRPSRLLDRNGRLGGDLRSRLVRPQPRSTSSSQPLRAQPWSSPQSWLPAQTLRLRSDLSDWTVASSVLDGAMSAASRNPLADSVDPAAALSVAHKSLPYFLGLFTSSVLARPLSAGLGDS